MWMTLLVATGGGVLGAVLVIAFKAIRKRRMQKARENVAAYLTQIQLDAIFLRFMQCELLRLTDTCDCDECRAARAEQESNRRFDEWKQGYPGAWVDQTGKVVSREPDHDPLEDMGYRRQGDI